MINFENIIAKGIHISVDKYETYWEQYDKLGIQARKLEFLQSYGFIDDMTAFNNDNYKKFLDFLKEFHANALGGKENIQRIHYVEYPLDKYLEMEYYTYLICDFYGQEIRVTNSRKLFPQKVYDFVLFENNNLFILNFGKNNDKSDGAWHVTDQSIIKEFANWYDNVFQKSANFKTMLKPNKEIIENMVKLGLIK